ncbi:hypothetical protein [Propioniferax innocua]|nr:hypothetical protein [Propioniferax innocua]
MARGPFDAAGSTACGFVVCGFVVLGADGPTVSGAGLMQRG